MNKSWLYIAIVLVLVVILLIFPTTKILHRMGYSKWWSVCMVIPFINVLSIWLLAFQAWPIENANKTDHVLEGELITAAKGDSSSLAAWGGGIMAIAVFSFGILQLFIGFAGIEHEFGKGWAWAALIVTFMGFTLPITVGAFFGAMHVWDWHWAAAALFAAPGLLFVVPGMIGVLANLLRGR